MEPKVVAIQIGNFAVDRMSDAAARRKLNFATRDFATSRNGNGILPVAFYFCIPETVGTQPFGEGYIGKEPSTVPHVQNVRCGAM